MREIIIKVSGMMCGGCENRIKNALSMIEGIETVEANHIDGNVKIVSKEDININEITEKINDLGFKVI